MRRRDSAFGDADEKFSVIASASAGRDHAVVARLLAVFAKRARDPPHARMKPEQRAHGANGDVERPVGGAYMRELVRERHALLRIAPSLGPRARHNNDWVE